MTTTIVNPERVRLAPAPAVVSDTWYLTGRKLRALVRQPFVLDFAGAHLDTRPEFAADVWADWEAEKREQFDKRWPMVQRMLEAFENIGIYLLDVSPGNIAFRD